MGRAMSCPRFLHFLDNDDINNKNMCKVDEIEIVRQGVALIVEG
jgi:hypothetical protein